MNKFLSCLLAVCLCLSFSVPALAASGYADSSAVGSNPVTSNQATTVTTAAIENAVSTGATVADVSFRNVSSVNASTLQSIAQDAANSGIQITVQIDKVENGKVISRMYIDPAQASNLSGDINLEVDVSGRNVNTVKNIFEKFYSNKMSVINFGQQGSFGMTVGMAVKVDLSEMDPASLVFYSYDKATNTYSQIANPGAYVDANGYLHFSTNLGGGIIISEGALVNK